MPGDPAQKRQVGARTDAQSRRGILVRTTPADEGLVERPALAPHLRFHVIRDQQTLLVSETFNTLLHGGLYCDLLPLLDGCRGRDEIVATLDGRHAAADLDAAVVSLSAKGYIVSAGHGMEPRRAGSNNGWRHRASR